MLELNCDHDCLFRMYQAYCRVHVPASLVESERPAAVPLETVSVREESFLF